MITKQEIEVTWSDIETAIASRESLGNEFRASRMCPIANAVHRVYGDNNLAVGYGELIDDSVDSFENDRNPVVGFLSDNAIDFQRDFDKEKPVLPIIITVTPVEPVIAM